MKIQESAENYLETIYMLSLEHPYVRSIDIATELSFSKPSVSVAMKNLRENGYISMDGDGYIHLEEPGLAIARRIIRHVNAAAGISVGCTVRLSIGIAVSSTETDTRPLFEKADRALYKVKRSGKNSCCLYMPQDDPTPPQP